MLINVRELCQRHNVHVSGILHLGGHHAEELQAYEELTKGPIVWVEGMAEACQKMREKLAGRSQHLVLQAWIGGREEKLPLYVASNGQSTSLRPPVLHLKHYPGIRFEKREEVQTHSLDDFYRELLLPMDIEPPDLLCMDVQGMEGEILLGGRDFVTQCNAVYMEVNTQMLYDDILLLPKIDGIMREYGFLRLDTVILAQGWGDAFYIRV